LWWFLVWSGEGLLEGYSYVGGGSGQLLGGLLLVWTWTWDGGESGKESEETYFVISERGREEGWLRDYPVGRACLSYSAGVLTVTQ